MNNVSLWAARFQRMHEAMLESAGEIEGDAPEAAEDMRSNALEWREWSRWLLEHAATLPSLPPIRVTETLGR